MEVCLVVCTPRCPVDKLKMKRWPATLDPAWTKWAYHPHMLEIVTVVFCRPCTCLVSFSQLYKIPQFSPPFVLSVIYFFLSAGIYFCCSFLLPSKWTIYCFSPSTTRCLRMVALKWFIFPINDENSCINGYDVIFEEHTTDIILGLS